MRDPGLPSNPALGGADRGFLGPAVAFATLDMVSPISLSSFVYFGLFALHVSGETGVSQSNLRGMKEEKWFKLFSIFSVWYVVDVPTPSLAGCPAMPRHLHVSL